MPRRSAPPTRKHKASGANIGEWQRGTVAVKLRLPEATAETLRTRARAHGMRVSTYVAGLVERDATGETSVEDP